MPVRTRPHKVWPGLLLGICGAALAADSDFPEADFLEYLGSWEESDEEWELFDIDEEQVAQDADERIDPAPEGEESTENDDES